MILCAMQLQLQPSNNLVLCRNRTRGATSLQTVSTDGGSIASSSIDMSPDSAAAALHGAFDTSGGFHRHPAFPDIPTSVALTYTLLVKACLSPTPSDRPTFPQILQILLDVEREVSTGTYIDSLGVPQASSALQGMPCNHQPPAARSEAAPMHSGSGTVDAKMHATQVPQDASQHSAMQSNLPAPLQPPTPELSNPHQGSSAPASLPLAQASQPGVPAAQEIAQTSTHAETVYLGPESGNSVLEEVSHPEDAKGTVELPEGATHKHTHTHSISLSGGLPTVPSGALEILERSVPPAEGAISTRMLEQIPEYSGSMGQNISQALVRDCITGDMNASPRLPRPKPDAQPQQMLCTPRDGSGSSASLSASQSGVLQSKQSSASTAYRSALHSTSSEEPSVIITAHPLGISAALSQDPSIESDGKTTSAFATAALAGSAMHGSAMHGIPASAEGTEACGEQIQQAESSKAVRNGVGRSPLQTLQPSQQPAESEQAESLDSVSLMPPQTPTCRSTGDPQSRSSHSSKQNSNSGEQAHAHAEDVSAPRTALHGQPAKVDSFHLTDFPEDSADISTVQAGQGEVAGEHHSQPQAEQQSSSLVGATGDVASEGGMSGLSQEGFGLPGLPMSGSLLAGGVPFSIAGLLGADMSLDDLAGDPSERLVVCTCPMQVVYMASVHICST